VRAWTPGQHPTTLVCCITQGKQPAFSLIDGTSAPTQTWPSRVSARTADCRTDVFLESTEVTTLAFPHNATEAQGSCPQRSGEALELSLCLLPDESVEGLPPPDTSNIEKAHQDFCESLLSAAKQCIPCGRRKNYVPCWDKECETLYRSFTRAPVGTDSDRAASSLLSRLGQKKQERWQEVVNSIDFSHSSRKAWRTINKHTDRSGPVA